MDNGYVTNKNICVKVAGYNFHSQFQELKNCYEKKNIMK